MLFLLYYNVPSYATLSFILCNLPAIAQLWQLELFLHCPNNNLFRLNMDP